MTQMTTALGLVLLVAGLAMKSGADRMNNLGMVESCQLVCNNSTSNYCYDFTGNYLDGSAVGRLCCITTQIPALHQLTVDYTNFLDRTVYAEILSWYSQPKPREYSTAYLECIRDCTLDHFVTHATCVAFMKDRSTCRRRQC